MVKISKIKLMLYFCNMLFLVSGASITGFGYFLCTDTESIFLSRIYMSTSDQFNSLPQPLLFYISIGLICAGLLTVLASIIGFWTTSLPSYCAVSLYFFMVVIFLLAESAFYLGITFWPNCLGISLDEQKVAESLQSYYGIPGNEQFTIAIDMAQTRFRCCGINSASDYQTSIWKLHGFGEINWLVPLSCCVLKNALESKSYLDPLPVNGTQCEALEKDQHANHRHPDSCFSYIHDWYHIHYRIFLNGSIIMIFLQFSILLCLFISCINKSRGFK